VVGVGFFVATQLEKQINKEKWRVKRRKGD
jgi:ribosome-associated translation inhibitor RaiA